MTKMANNLMNKIFIRHSCVYEIRTRNYAIKSRSRQERNYSRFHVDLTNFTKIYVLLANKVKEQEDTKFYKISF